LSLYYYRGDYQILLISEYGIGHTIQGCGKNLYSLFTPWSRFLLEKLTGFQLKKFLTFYGTRRFITALTSACHLSLSSPGLRLTVWMFCNKVHFYGEKLLAPRPIPKLEDHPLSTAHDCQLNIFAATLHIAGRSSVRNLRTHHAVVTGTHLSQGEKFIVT